MYLPQKRTLPPYRIMSLEALLEEAVEHGDPEALRELHDNRFLFGRAKDQRLRLAEYVDKLRETAMNGNGSSRRCSDDVAYRAYSLTVEKFLSLPRGNPNTGNEEEGEAPTRRVIDCRNYLRPALARYRAIVAAEPDMGALQRETLLSRLLEKHVARHFELSIAECLRSANPFVSRYEWKLNGKSLYEWFPIDFPGHARAAWLEANVEDPDPYRPGEKRRVQDIIDRRLAKGRHVDLEECENAGITVSTSQSSLSFAVLYGISTEGLAKVVAEEKVFSIQYQRPAIKRMGPQRLRGMILHIFRELDSGEYNDGEIADRYLLSRPSFSRFAGSRWQRARTGQDGAYIPDLFVNIAHVLAAHNDFVEAAKAVGIWPRVRKIVQECRPRGPGRTSHVE